MGCAASTGRNAKYGDLRDFVALHCELSPKAHTAYNELFGALYAFLSARGVRLTGYEGSSLMQELATTHGLAFNGPRAYGNMPYAHVAVCGIRLKLFPADGSRATL